jgi:hypothetical protein
MSIDTTFKPATDLLVVDNSAAAQVPGASQKGVTTFRCVARVANAYLAWGRTSAVAAPTVPAAVGVKTGSASGGIIGLTVGQPVYLELPPDSFFISSAVFATSNVEITGGTGGCGSG